MGKKADRILHISGGIGVNRKHKIAATLILLVFLVLFSGVVLCQNLDQALSNFIEEYSSTKENTWKLLEGDSLDDLKNPLILSDARVPDIKLLELKYYDFLGSTSSSLGSRVEGKLFFSGFMAFKEISGNNLNFGYDHVYEETKMYLYEKGDKVYERGTLNLDRDELEIQSFWERDGAIFEKTVLELTKIKDQSYILQYFFWKEGKNTKGVFMDFTDSELNFIVARGETAGDLEYESIQGTNMTAEKMSEGYTKLLAVQVKDGQVTYQEN